MAQLRAENNGLAAECSRIKAERESLSMECSRMRDARDALQNDLEHSNARLNTVTVVHADDLNETEMKLNTMKSEYETKVSELTVYVSCRGSMCLVEREL